MPLGEHVARAVGQPSAGFGERLAQEAHDQVDGAAVGIAHEAAEGTTAHAVGQAGMVVVVEGAQALVARDVQPQALGHILDGEGAQAVYFVLFHNAVFFVSERLLLCEREGEMEGMRTPPLPPSPGPRSAGRERERERGRKSASIHPSIPPRPSENVTLKHITVGRAAIATPPEPI